MTAELASTALFNLETAPYSSELFELFDKATLKAFSDFVRKQQFFLHLVMAEAKRWRGRAQPTVLSTATPS